VAGIDLADRHAALAQRLAEGFRKRLAVVIKIALGGDVLGVERIGVGLVGEGRPVPHDDDMAAGPQSGGKRFVVGGRLRVRNERERGEKAARGGKRDGASGNRKHESSPKSVQRGRAAAWATGIWNDTSSPPTQMFLREKARPVGNKSGPARVAFHS